MNAFLTSPTRNLIGGVLFVLTVGALAVAGYMSQGWSSGDALYMVVLTVFTVGYDEVHPIATLPLRAITMGLIVTGCTGMIFVTGALVQFITLSGIQQALGHKYMSRQIDQLRNHVIICGFGRTGTMLARELQAGGAAFVVLERDPDRIEEARGLDYLCLHGDATEEDTLRHAGIERARALATVLPEDAINVYITLTARSLNKTMMIVARGELPSTISKLQYAGATEVVLPAHIGAERIAELILYPEAANAMRDERIGGMEKQLHDLGLELELVVAEQGSAFAGRTVAEIEHEVGPAFFVVAIDRPASGMIARPAGSTTIEPADGVVILGRANRAEALRGFQAGG
ncbi:MAG TPA: potassium channel protein [Acetobacteraceae bacterium]|nr:potassium channel protein [Acetobacteraceae bacterium]